MSFWSIRSLSCCILLLVVFISGVSSCGVTTHNVIAQRALTWFAKANPDYGKIIQNHLNAFQNGAAFPDWGYGCLLKQIDPERYSDLPDASEGSHWPPFQNVTVQYIRKNFPKPWNDEAQKLIAFLLGVVSHATADILWHDLEYVGKYNHAGFIQTVADIDYNARGSGYKSDAHSESDTGGEFVAAHAQSLEFLLSEWYLPSKALAEIFVNWGFVNVTPAVIEACNLELYAEVQAIKNLGKVPYTMFADRSQFLVENYYDFFVGGINDNAFWTSKCWPYIINWIENGVNDSICLVESRWGWVPPNKRTKNQIIPYSVEYGLIKQSSRYNERLGIRTQLRKLVDQFKEQVSITHERTLNGLVITSKPLYASKKRENLLTSGLPLATSCLAVNQTKPYNAVTFFTTLPHSSLGKAVAVGDFDADGLADVVVGAPSYSTPQLPRTGAVWIFYSKLGASVKGNLNLNVDQPLPPSSPFRSIVKLNATNRGGSVHFGEALVVLDFNRDGIDDLVVSLPGDGAENLTYAGRVHVFFGKKQIGIVSTQNPDVVILPPDNLNSTNLGSSLAKGDVNNDGVADLIVGAPLMQTSQGYQTGAVWVFFSDVSRSKSPILTSKDVDFALEGDDMFQWFGQSVIVRDVIDQQTSKKKKFMFVGAPTYNHNNQSALGKLFSFDITDLNQTKTQFVLEGTEVFDKLGFSFDVGRPIITNSNVSRPFILALSLPTRQVQSKNQAGLVVLFDVQQLQGSIKVNETKPMTSFFSDDHFARLGYRVRFNDFNGDSVDDLFLSQPWKSLFLETLDGGRNFVFLGGKQFPVGDVTNLLSTAHTCIESHSHYALLGREVETLDFSKSGIKKDLLLSAPTSSDFGAEQAGAVSLLLAPVV